MPQKFEKGDFRVWSFLRGVEFSFKVRSIVQFWGRQHGFHPGSPHSSGYKYSLELFFLFTVSNRKFQVIKYSISSLHYTASTSAFSFVNS